MSEDLVTNSISNVKLYPHSWKESAFVCAQLRRHFLEMQQFFFFFFFFSVILLVFSPDRRHKESNLRKHNNKLPWVSYKYTHSSHHYHHHRRYRQCCHNRRNRVAVSAVGSSLALVWPQRVPFAIFCAQIRRVWAALARHHSNCSHNMRRMFRPSRLA